MKINLKDSIRRELARLNETRTFKSETLIETEQGAIGFSSAVVTLIDLLLDYAPPQ